MESSTAKPQLQLLQNRKDHTISRTTKKSKKGLTDFNFNLARKKREGESKVEVKYNFSAGDATEIQFLASKRGRGQTGQDRSWRMLRRTVQQKQEQWDR